MIISVLKIKEKGWSISFFLENWLAICLIIMLIFCSIDLIFLWDINFICGIECGDGEAKRVFENRNSYLVFCVFIFVIFVMNMGNNKHWFLIHEFPFLFLGFSCEQGYLEEKQQM